MLIGIDYAWSHPSIPAILGYGAKWAARYLSTDSSKNLQPAERDALRAAGLGILLVWETTPSRMLGGAAAGTADAQRAMAQAQALGYPRNCVVYYACDWDATLAQQPTIDAYGHAVRAAHAGYYRSGIYGGYYPVRRALNNGSFDEAWQTYAWSDGQWDGRAAVRQVLNGIRVGGVDCDRDELWADGGLWHNTLTGGTGTMGILDDPTVQGNFVKEIDYTLGGYETVTLTNTTTGQPEEKPLVPNQRLRVILETVQAIQANGGIVTDAQLNTVVTQIVAGVTAAGGGGITDAQIQQIINGVSAALGGMVAGIADSVATELAGRLGRDVP